MLINVYCPACEAYLSVYLDQNMAGHTLCVCGYKVVVHLTVMAFKQP